MDHHPVLYHVAEDGAWPSIQEHGLLSTRALTDLFDVKEPIRKKILHEVRKSSVIIHHEKHGSVVIRDQRPLKYLDQVLLPGTAPEDFLRILNDRVFFWVSSKRVDTLMKAARNRGKAVQTVLMVSTSDLLARYGSVAELTPYNTGSTFVKSAPRRGVETFTPVAAYPYESWQKKRGPSGEAAVELTVPHGVCRVRDMALCVERWEHGVPTAVLHKR